MNYELLFMKSFVCNRDGQDFKKISIMYDGFQLLLSKFILQLLNHLELVRLYIVLHLFESDIQSQSVLTKTAY